MAAGRPVSDPRLRRYALRRIRYARDKFLNLQDTLAGDRRRRRFVLLIMIGLGLSVLLSGLSPLNTVTVAIGASDVGLGIFFILLEPLAGYVLRWLIGGAARAERIQIGNPDK